MKRTVGLIMLALLGVGPALAQDAAQGAQPAAEQASVRIAHLVPDGAQVDVLIDDKVVFQGLQAGTVSGYLLVPAGEHSIELLPAGATEEAPAAETQPAAPAQPAPAQPAAPATQPGATPAAPPAPPEPLANTTLSFDAGNYYTVLATASGLTIAQEEPAEAGRAQAQTGGGTGGAAGDGATGGAEQPEEAAQTGGAQAAAETGGAETGGAGAAQAGAGDVGMELVTDTFADFPQAGQALVRVIHASPTAGSVSMVAMRTSAQGPEAAKLEDEAGAAADERAQSQTGGEAGGGATGGAAQTGGAADGAAQTGGAAERAQGGPAPITGQNLVQDLAPGAVSDYQSIAGGTYHLQLQTGDGGVAVDLPDTVLEPGVIYTFYTYGNPDGGVLSLAVSVDALVARETGNQ